MQFKNMIIVLLAVTLLISIMPADQSSFRGGAGGMEIGYLPIELDEIDQQLAQINLPGLPDHIYLVGGGGWGYVGRNFRIGGYGYGGNLNVNNKIDGIAREFDMELSAGGFAVEKAFHPLRATELYVGCTIGGGEIKAKLTRWSDIPSWESVWEGYDPAKEDMPDLSTSHLSNSFVMVSPNVGIRYNVLDWFAIGANLGYFYTYMEEDNWQVNDKSLINAPSIDLSNLVYKVNFFFGG
ncbi:MAG: hypothetical protein K9N00_03625 [Candidatus Marinimicrobia bacterium]|nr:hypothetical protein [Candidatus Neomarinimicrobiota bacterium]